jgi:hypothetical protein
VQKRGLVWPRAKLLSHIHKMLVSNSGLELSGCEFLFFTGESQDSTDHIFRSECVQSFVCNNYIISFTAKKPLLFICHRISLHNRFKLSVYMYACICVCMYVLRMYVCMYVGLHKRNTRDSELLSRPFRDKLQQASNSNNSSATLLSTRP